MPVLILEPKPRIVLFSGNRMMGNQVFNYLTEREEKVVAYFNEDSVIDMGFIRKLQADVGITCYWPYLIDAKDLDVFKHGCINFHPSPLPRYRGWYPAVWQIINNEKIAGVTLHLIDEGADTGPVIAQRLFPIKETDTGETLYGRSQVQMIELFKEIWPELFEGIELQKQNDSDALYRSKKDANNCDEIHLDRRYSAGNLINLIRAKTFRDKGYAYYVKNGKKYHVKIEITEDE